MNKVKVFLIKYRKVSLVLGAIILITMVWQLQLLVSNDKTKKPNLIFIQAGELSLETLSCYGESRMYTPNIDLLAFQGKLYTNCTRTEVSDKKGSDQNSLHKDMVQLNKKLKDNGYETLIISGTDLKKKSNNRNGKDAYISDQITDNTIDFIKKTRLKHSFSVFVDYSSCKSDNFIARRHSANVDQSVRPELLAIDENVGRLYRFIEDIGISDNTLIVFVSDVDGKDKQAIPLIVRYPSLITPNTVSNANCSLKEVFELILQVSDNSYSEI